MSKVVAHCHISFYHTRSVTSILNGLFITVYTVANLNDIMYKGNAWS